MVSTFLWWKSHFISGSYIQYISISLSNYPHVRFWKWNKDIEMWQSDVVESHWSSTLSLSNRGVRANCQREKTFSLCYPTGSIRLLLTQGWMTRVNNSKVLPCLFSHNVPSVLWSWCKLKSGGRDGSTVGLLLHPPCCLKHKLKSLIYIEVIQGIWLKKSPFLQINFRQSGKDVNTSVELRSVWTALKLCEEEFK